MWCALLVVRAFVSFGLSLVWSAFFGNQVSVFGEETVEEWPAAVAALVHIVARHQILRGQLGHLLPVLYLQPILGNLRERHRVARAAMALVPVLIHEVVAADISPIKVVGKLRVWYRFSIWVRFLELLCLCDSSLEVGSLTELNLANWLTAGLSKQ